MKELGYAIGLALTGAILGKVGKTLEKYEMYKTSTILECGSIISYASSIILTITKLTK